MAMQQYRDSVLGILACLLGLTMAAAAHAQAPRSKVEMPATPGVPEFRDPKTGQIWTPLNVGQQSGPPTPAHPALRPRGRGAPEVRDPRTGEIWRRRKVGGRGAPPTPADLAFDPRGQAVSVRGVVMQ